MADENNLTTLAKRLRPLLGNFVQGLVKSVIGEGPGIDLVVSGDITTVGLGGDSFLLYDDGGLPVAEYSTLTLALAAAATGNVIITPAGIFTEDVTIPAGVGVRSIGNNTIIVGTIILAGNASFLASITISLTVNQSGAITSIIGPSSGEAMVGDCNILVTNNGVGDAYIIQMGNGDLIVKNTRGRCYTNGGGDALAVYGVPDSTGKCQTQDCMLDAITTGGGDGHGAATDGTADFDIRGGKIEATTSPIRM
jgi:hypothetical protein